MLLPLRCIQKLFLFAASVKCPLFWIESTSFDFLVTDKDINQILDLDFLLTKFCVASPHTFAKSFWKACLPFSLTVHVHNFQCGRRHWKLSWHYKFRKLKFCLTDGAVCSRANFPVRSACAHSHSSLWLLCWSIFLVINQFSNILTA